MAVLHLFLTCPGIARALLYPHKVCNILLVCGPIVMLVLSRLLVDIAVNYVLRTLFLLMLNPYLFLINTIMFHILAAFLFRCKFGMSVELPDAV